jgi:hypothetical protein
MYRAWKSGRMPRTLAIGPGDTAGNHLRPLSASTQGLAEGVCPVWWPYWNRFDLPGEHSVILRRVGHDLLDDVTEDDIEELYTFSEWLALSGLAARRCLRHDGYSNRDHFRLSRQVGTVPARIQGVAHDKSGRMVP